MCLSTHFIWTLSSDLLALETCQAAKAAVSDQFLDQISSHSALDLNQAPDANNTVTTSTTNGTESPWSWFLPNFPEDYSF